MFILAIETTGPFGSTALLDEKGNVLGCEVSRETMSHLKDLIPMVDTMLKKCGVSKDQIDLLAPSVGPGSFTGIRIGVSTARALCQALGIKAVPVPTLEAFCFKETADMQTASEAAFVAARKSGDHEAGGNGSDGHAAGIQAASRQPACGRTAVCAIINARRGQVYGMIDGFMEPGPYMLTDVLDVYKSKVEPDGGKLLFYGDGIDAYEKDIIEALGQPGPGPECCYEFAPEEDRYQDAVSVGKWAVERIRQAGGISCGLDGVGDDAGAGGVCGLDGAAVDYENLLPDYMRRAEAEQKLESGELPICKGPKQE